jgi:predicted nucleic acid-binding protein
MLYLDASALVKRYVNEDGSETIRREMSGASLSTCRVCFVETVRAVGLTVGERGVRRVEGDWPWFRIVEVDRRLSERAARLALAHRLRALDALHLAAALSLSNEELTIATWDMRLHRAARKERLATLPVALA